MQEARPLAPPLDGARFANACASLHCTPAEVTWKSGVDVLCFGGTKNGMAVGEAVLFFDRKLAAIRLPVQAGRATGIEDALSFSTMGRNAGKRGMDSQRAPRKQFAQYFAGKIAGIPEVRVSGPVEANAVFLDAPEALLNRIRERG